MVLEYEFNNWLVIMKFNTNIKGEVYSRSIAPLIVQILNDFKQLFVFNLIRDENILAETSSSTKLDHKRKKSLSIFQPKKKIFYAH